MDLLGKMGDALVDKGAKHVDLNKNRWTEAKMKELKPDDLMRAKYNWLADQNASSMFKGISEIEKANRFCSLLDGADRLRMANNLKEKQDRGTYNWKTFVETWMFPEGKAAATEVVRAKVQRKCHENESMTHYFEGKVDLLRWLNELCPLEAEKSAALREKELVNSFKEGLCLSANKDCAVTKVLPSIFPAMSRASALVLQNLTPPL